MSLARFLTKPPVDVYPLLAAVGAASGLAVFMSFRYLTQTQDIVINKANQESWQSHNKTVAPLYSMFYRKNNLITPMEGMRKNPSDLSGASI